MCMAKAVEDLKGKKFGNWTVLVLIGRKPGSHRLWSCKCDCGTVKECSEYNLRKGTSKSCGCLRVAKVKKASKKIKEVVSVTPPVESIPEVAEASVTA